MFLGKLLDKLSYVPYYKENMTKLENELLSFPSVPIDFDTSKRWDSIELLTRSIDELKKEIQFSTKLQQMLNEQHIVPIIF